MIEKKTDTAAEMCQLAADLHSTALKLQTMPVPCCPDGAFVFATRLRCALDVIERYLGQCADVFSETLPAGFTVLLDGRPPLIGAQLFDDIEGC